MPRYHTTTEKPMHAVEYLGYRITNPLTVLPKIYSGRSREKKIQNYAWVTLSFLSGLHYGNLFILQYIKLECHGLPFLGIFSLISLILSKGWNAWTYLHFVPDGLLDYQLLCLGQAEARNAWAYLHFVPDGFLNYQLLCLGQAEARNAWAHLHFVPDSFLTTSSCAWARQRPEMHELTFILSLIAFLTTSSCAWARQRPEMNELTFILSLIAFWTTSSCAWARQRPEMHELTFILSLMAFWTTSSCAWARQRPEITVRVSGSRSGVGSFKHGANLRKFFIDSTVGTLYYINSIFEVGQKST